MLDPQRMTDGHAQELAEHTAVVDEEKGVCAVVGETKDSTEAVPTSHWDPLVLSLVHKALPEVVAVANSNDGDQGEGGAEGVSGALIQAEAETESEVQKIMKVWYARLDAARAKEIEGQERANKWREELAHYSC